MDWLNVLLAKSDGNDPVKSWCTNQLQYLNTALRDIRTCAQTYKQILNETPLTYLMLANKNSKGFDMLDLFKNANDEFTTWKVFRNNMPLHQMGRLMQVNAIHRLLSMS
jgi:hypothetical protein